MEEENLIKIENWSVSTDNPTAPPEAGLYNLQGEVYNHPRLQDGKSYTTSYIMDVEGDIVTTRTGNRYKLGEPLPEYIAWCKKQGCHVPTKEVPIKIHKK